ncbi:MAG: bifunctional diguanylate cyclase/phosphodiesterase [Proteobacteria bacterium]|nr:MAG: bifunctional diguanylate cyclase/phosphodiesterase [Pseudomonadota bacterium]
MQNTHLKLPDRGQLLAALEHSLIAAEDAGDLVAVIVLKIQRLKDVSIEFGYTEGDAVIQHVIERLQHCIRQKDLLARINNDEFALVLPGLKNPAQPVMAINKIQRSCNAPIEICGREIKIKLAFGTSISPDDAQRADALLRCADIALRDAESNGLESVRYHAHDTAETSPILQLETDLELAINASTLQALYQPIINIESGEIAGVEMLARWPNGPFGEVPPAVFVDTAERCELIMPLSVWCLNNALRECGDWQSVLPNVPVAVNFSSVVVADPHLPEVVLSALSLWDTQAVRLTVEVTESAIMSDPQACMAVLNQLHAHGVKIAIDNFGTGYSSLAYLEQLPVDTLKIDQLFVSDLVKNMAHRRIVQTVIDLAHNFDLSVVAKGVEDEETLDTLTMMGCQYAQGFYVGQPMRSGELENWFQSSPWEPVDVAHACV